jgi:hypothetical protein
MSSLSPAPPETLTLPRKQHVNGRSLVKDFRPVVVVHRRPICSTDRFVESQLNVGEFTHTEFYDPSQGFTLATFMGSHYDCSFTLPLFYETMPDKFAWNLIILTDKEYDRWTTWNAVQVSRKIPYNCRDLPWAVAPDILHVSSYMHDINKEKCVEPTRMFCSQAVILSLREAYSGSDSNPQLKAFVDSMNSRITTPTKLQEKLEAEYQMPLQLGAVPLNYEQACQFYIKTNPMTCHKYPGLV